MAAGRSTGKKVWTSGAQLRARGLATVRNRPQAPKHAGITTVIVDMKAPEVEVRPLRQMTGGSDFNEVCLQRPVRARRGRGRGAQHRGGRSPVATLGNERVSIGGSGSFYEGLATQLVQLVGEQPDRLAGGQIRVGSYLAEENALRLLNLRRVARSVEGAGPGPRRQRHQAEVGRSHGRRRGDHAALLGPEGARCSTGPAWLSGRHDHGRTRHGDRRRHLRGDPQSDRPSGYWACRATALIN